MPKLNLTQEQLEYLHKTVDRTDIWILVNEELNILAGIEAQKEQAAANYKAWEDTKDEGWKCQTLIDAGL